MYGKPNCDPSFQKMNQCWVTDPLVWSGQSLAFMLMIYLKVVHQTRNQLHISCPCWTDQQTDHMVCLKKKSMTRTERTEKYTFVVRIKNSNRCLIYLGFMALSKSGNMKHVYKTKHFHFGLSLLFIAMNSFLISKHLNGTFFSSFCHGCHLYQLL